MTSHFSASSHLFAFTSHRSCQFLSLVQMRAKHGTVPRVKKTYYASGGLGKNTLVLTSKTLATVSTLRGKSEIIQTFVDVPT